jgi:uncharacterized glyoxalase superfamily protein PhnB
MHAEIAIGDSLVMLGQAGGPWRPRSAALYLWVEDVDATYARALEAGATSESEPEDRLANQSGRPERLKMGHTTSTRAIMLWS